VLKSLFPLNGLKGRADSMTECSIVENIGPGERRKRLMIGTAMLAAGLVIWAVLISTGVDRWWRLVLLIPFWMGALGFFQAKEKT
jgi:hypothetical protein